MAVRAQLVPAAEDRAAGGQRIDGSLTFNSVKEQYLSRTFVQGNQRTWTWSGWVKRNTGFATRQFFIQPYTANGEYTFYFSFDNMDTDCIQIGHYPTSWTYEAITREKYRDVGWYHVFLGYDSTQSTAADRIKLYVNGTLQTLWFDNGTWPSQNDSVYMNQAGQHDIGRSFANYADWQMSQVYLIDGQQLEPTDFGYTDELTGTWRPKKYTGSYTQVSYNTAITWSGSSSNITNPANAFNGSTASGTGDCYANAGANSDGYWDLPSNIVATKVECYIDPAHTSVTGAKFYARDTGSTQYTYTTSSVSGDSGWVEIPLGGATRTINRLGCIRNSGGSGSALFAWRITNTDSSGTIVTNEILIDGMDGRGANSFYLPFDGIAPIGEDQSGKGNDFTPVNFGGSTVIPKATGALPILNTVSGGKVAVPGVRGQAGVAVTVYNSGSGNKYYLDGEEAKTVSYKRGQIVTFDTSDSTVSGHPFRFATAADAAGSTQYTTGSVTSVSEGSVGAATTITFPIDAPETLYYYCTNHSGMGGSITGITTDVQVADPHASKCVLALPLVDNANDVSNQLNGGSTTKAFTVTNTVASSKKSIFYSESFYFDGSGDYLDTAANADYAFGTGDFTVECWIRNGGHSATGNVIDARTDPAGWGLQLSSSEYFTFYSKVSASSVLGNMGPILENTWTHLAVTRSSGTLYGFINGVLQNSASHTSDYSTNTPVVIGGRYSKDQQYFNGYIQDVRIYKGAAKYTSSFIPASTNPNILPETPSGVAYASELTKVTEGAVAFDGNGDYLSLESTSDFAFGTGDFTLECWAYHSDASVSSSYPYLFEMRDPGGGGNRISLYVTNTNTIQLWVDGVIFNTGYFGTRRWNHVAISRVSGNLRLFNNGQIVDTHTTEIDFTGAPLLIGQRDGYAAQSWPGFISNVRIVKGTGIYTSSFIPPSGPLTNITNTKLLCCQGSSAYNYSPVRTGTASFNLPLSSAPFTDSSSNTYTVTNTGSVTTASAGTNNFNITNAASFDGSSQRLNMNSNVTLTGDWTIDAWIKLDSSASGYNAIYNSGYTSSNNTYIYMSVDDDEKPYLEGGSAGGRTTATNAINKNQWYHFRAIQAAGSMHLYVDGEKVVTHGQNTTDMSSLGTDCIGSLVSNGNNANNFHGLIGPVRYVSSTLGPPPVGGLPTTAGALSNTPDISLGVAGDAAATNFNPFDTDINTVMGQETGYCTLNPLWNNSSVTNGGYPPLLKDGNLTADYQDGTPSGDYFKSALGTIGLDSTKGGKWYFEGTSAGGDYVQIGMVREEHQWEVGKSGWGLSGSEGGLCYQSDGSFAIHRSSMTTNKKDASTYGQMMSFLIDFDNKTVNTWVDGIDIGYTVDITSYLSDANPLWYPGISLGGWGLTEDETMYVNFGQKPFKYTPPEGFLPINLANLPRPLPRPDQHVKSVVYTGEDSSNTSGTGNTWGVPVDVGFDPDLVIIKSRTQTYGWYVFDSIRRGDDSAGDPVPGDLECYNHLSLNLTDAEDNSYDNGISLRTNGFNVDVEGYSICQAGQGTHNFVAWCWKAGGWKGTWNLNGKNAGSATAAGLTTGDTSVLSAASINTKAGFSIVKWTQDSGGSSKNIAHGLTQAPNFVIMKHLNSTSNWYVTHTSLSSGAKILYTNTNDDEDTSSDFGNAFPGATYTATQTTGVNGREVIMYSWHNISGLQKFGSYVANNNASGPYVYLGFKPTIVWVKLYSGGDNNWVVWDRARMEATGNNSSTQGVGNPNGNTLQMNDATEEPTSSHYFIDFLSDGFKVRDTDSCLNGGDESYKYVYCAWAEAPSFNLYGGQSNAL